MPSAFIEFSFETTQLQNGQNGKNDTMAAKIIVDEEEPEVDVDDFPFEPRDVQIRRDKWVLEEFRIFEMLGKGKFGEVKRCIEKKTGREFAAKFIATPTAQDKEDVIHEIDIMKKLQHKRLLQLYDAFSIRSDMCLVLEVILGGELFDRVICDDFVLTEKACRCFVKQICEGVDYMHSKNIIHLDMKPENILCLTKTGNRVKIIDFGLAREFDPKKELRVLFGTPEFMAPEVVNYEPISFVTDMWSVGVICYVLLSGLSPFMGDNDGETLVNVIKGEYDFDYPEFDEISDEALDFIKRLLVLPKHQRMTASQALAHEWLAPPSPPPTPPLPRNKKTLSNYVHKKKWQKAFNTMVALHRMGADLSALSRENINDVKNNTKPNVPPKPKPKMPETKPKPKTDSKIDTRLKDKLHDLASHSPFKQAQMAAPFGTMAVDYSAKPKDTSGAKPKDTTGAKQKKTPPSSVNDAIKKSPKSVMKNDKLNGPVAPPETGPNKITSQSDSNKENGPLIGRRKGVNIPKITIANPDNGTEANGTPAKAITNSKPNANVKMNGIADRIKSFTGINKPPIPPKPGGSTHNAHRPQGRKWQKGSDRYIVVTNKVSDAINFFTVNERREMTGATKPPNTQLGTVYSVQNRSS